MFLLAYRSSRHETTKVSPSEIYFARNLRLPLDLLRGIPPGEEGHLCSEDYVLDLRKKLDMIYEAARETVDIKSERVKSAYDQKAREVDFTVAQKVWFYNPRREKGKAPKLQTHWEGPYEVVKKLSDVVYCIQKSHRYKKKIIHADRLASFYERQLE